MIIKKTFIEKLIIIEPKLFKDDRGFFYESYNKNNFENIIKTSFVQDNESKSIKGVIRGLHFQKPPYAQTKLVRCVSGKILDIVIDLRKNSKTYGKSFSIELSSENNKQLFIPKGFAHGFISLSEVVKVNYQVDNYYSSEHEFGINPFDNDLKINWILEKNQININDKDKSNKNLSKLSPYKF